MFQAKKAQRRRRPLKVSMEGLSGGGKTYTALRLAFDMIRRGIGKRIVVLDSENESASLYAGVTEDGAAWDYDVVDIPAAKRNPAGYAEAYEWAVGAGYDIVIVDSLSHAWHGALQDVDKYAASHRGDKLGGWANLSPQQQRMIQTLTDPRAHCICTMRVKSDFQDQEVNGKVRKVKVGMKADQRDNTEYEYDIVLRFEAGNEVYVEKVRGCSAMNGQTATRPGPKFWKPLLDWWLAADETPAPVVKPTVDALPVPDATTVYQEARAALQSAAAESCDRLKSAWVAVSRDRAFFGENLFMSLTMLKDELKAKCQQAKPAPAAESFEVRFGNRVGMALSVADLDVLDTELDDTDGLTDTEYSRAKSILRAAYAKFPA
jgi:hypothetical protein